MCESTPFPFTYLRCNIPQTIYIWLIINYMTQIITSIVGKNTQNKFKRQTELDRIGNPESLSLKRMWSWGRLKWARTWGFFLQAMESHWRLLSRKVTYMKVTFEEDETSVSVHHRLQGDSCYRKSLQGGYCKSACSKRWPKQGGSHWKLCFVMELAK